MPKLFGQKQASCLVVLSYTMLTNLWQQQLLRIFSEIFPELSPNQINYSHLTSQLMFGYFITWQLTRNLFPSQAKSRGKEQQSG